MRRVVLPAVAVAMAGLVLPASANDRYVERPPVVVSPDLSAPWVMQLGHKPGRVVFESRQAFPDAPAPRRGEKRQRAEPQVQTAAVAPREQQAVHRVLDPMYLPQTIAYEGAEQPGTIIIDTVQNFLFLVEADGTRAALWRRHRKTRLRMGRHPQGDAQGRMAGLASAGRDDRARARQGPHLAGAHGRRPGNPLGARALYLGSTLYRIHGTNQPWTIGQAVSSGCIRMRNEDVVDLYERVGVGTKVVVM